jgi:hypothetical protein
VPPHTTATLPRRAMSAMAASASRTNLPAVMRSSQGSATSNKWCFTRACSAADGLLDPTSRPRYTCTESALTYTTRVLYQLGQGHASSSADFRASTQGAIAD